MDARAQSLDKARLSIKIEGQKQGRCERKCVKRCFRSIVICAADRTRRDVYTEIEFSLYNRILFRQIAKDRKLLQTSPHLSVRLAFPLSRKKRDKCFETGN